MAPDKLQYALACLLISLLVAMITGRSTRPGLRHRAMAIGSAALLTAKEAADKAGFFGFTGTSPKDAAAALALTLVRRRCRKG
ncbi:hypothetical protein BAE44_0022178 [Dichanthelium oligosanthes]|uniref:Uncharacterized protein n=1 Tax=Dichanthelium oligosanthes TaxID=888268 RepID=A0A1E5UVC2_9POAL|nr:hypothetical protein BAE44_0022178 [Dichanthelium oligosanthes]